MVESGMNPASQPGKSLIGLYVLNFIANFTGNIIIALLNLFSPLDELRDWRTFVADEGLLLVIIFIPLVDAYLRRRIIPIFFPRGRLSDTPVRIKISIIRRIRFLFGLGTSAPMFLLMGTIGFGVWQSARTSAEVAAFGREILVFVGVVWVIFVCLSLSLNILAGRSILQPIRLMLRQVDRIKKGDYQHRVQVVTNDELAYWATA